MTQPSVMLLSPGLCGGTDWTRDRPCPQRRLCTSPAAGWPSGAGPFPLSGMSADSRWKGTRSQYKWASVWCKRRTTAPGSHVEDAWFEEKESEFDFPPWSYLKKNTVMSVKCHLIQLTS